MEIKKFLAGLACAIIVFIIVFATHKNDVIWLLQSFSAWLNKHPLGPLLVFILISITAFPPVAGYSTLVIFTGFVYGMKGWFLASSAAIFGASTVFLLTRKLKIGFTMDANWMLIARVIEKKGLWFVLLLRIAPSPFNLSNVIFAVTKVDFKTFLAATAISTIKLLMHIYLGSCMVGNFEIKSEGPLLIVSIGTFIFASVVCYKTVQKEILLESGRGEELLNVHNSNTPGVENV